MTVDKKISILPDDEKLIALHLQEIRENQAIYTRIRTTNGDVKMTLLGNDGVVAFNPTKPFHASPLFPQNGFNNIIFSGCQAIAQSTQSTLEIKGLEHLEHRRFLVDPNFQKMGLGKLMYDLHNKLSGKPEIEVLPYLSMQRFYVKEGMIPSKIHYFDNSKELKTFCLSPEMTDYMKSFVLSKTVQEELTKPFRHRLETPFVLELKQGQEPNHPNNSYQEESFKALLDLTQQQRRSRNNLGSHEEALLLPPRIEAALFQTITSCGKFIPTL